MTWEEIKSIIDKLVIIKCELKDVEYKLEFAWDDWIDYVDENTIKILEDGLKKRRGTLIKQQEECYSNIKDFVMDDAFTEEWISCGDMMPDEPGIHVLVTDGVHIMESWYEIIEGEKLWVDNYTMYVNIKFGEVTHWRPIPELPKAKQ